MTMGTKKEVMREHLRNYLKASKTEKGKILDALEVITGIHRKAVIRGLKREQMRDSWKSKKKPGPKRIYTAEVIAALKEVWKAGNEVCGELLHPMLGEYIDILIRDRMWQYGDETTQKLRKMSLGTMKRGIGMFVQDTPGSEGNISNQTERTEEVDSRFSWTMGGQTTGVWAD